MSTLAAAPARSIEQTILHLGDKHPTLSPAEDVQQCARMVLDEFGAFPGEIAECIAACMLELPQKMAFYIDLVAQTQQKREVAEAVVALVWAAMRKSAACGGPWRHFTQALRILTALVPARVLCRESLLALLASVLDAADRHEPAAGGDFLLWSVCAAVPLVGVGAAGVPAELLDTLAQRIEARSAAQLSVPKDLAAVWACAASAAAAPPAEASDAAPIKLECVLADVVAVDACWDGGFEPLALFPELEEAGALEGWTLNFYLRYLVESVELNHRRCADLLLNGVPGGSERLVAQFLLGELIRNRTNRVRGLVYETLLMDCCRLSRLFPPAMARALAAIYDRLDDLGFVASDRLAGWFAHHLSNFDCKWNWRAWSPVLSAPPTSMQYVFVRLSLEKLLRLSYYDRVIASIPEEFRALLPAEPVPNYKYASAEGLGGEAELSLRLSKMIQSRLPADEIRGALGEPADGVLDATQREVLLQSLLNVGSRSLSHMLAVIEKYLALFQLLLPSPTAADATARLSASLFILDQTASFWRTSMLHFEFIVERLLNYRVLAGRTVVGWIFARADEQLSDVEVSFYHILSHTLARDLLMRTVQQSSTMPATARRKMQGVPDDRVEATVASLQADFEATLTLALEKLAVLRDQVIGTDETVAATELFCTDLVRELVSLYPRECGRLAKLVLNAAGRRAPRAIQAVLEQAHLQP